MSGTDAFIDNVTAGQPILETWGDAVADRLNGRPWIATAFPIGYSSDAVTTAAQSLAAVSAALAGCMAIPFLLYSHMSLQSVTIRNGSTSAARDAQFGLYYDAQTSSSTLTRVVGTNGTFSFTPAAEDDRTANITTPGTLLVPGAYWLIIRNTSASQTFQIRVIQPTGMAPNVKMVVTTATAPALSTTFDTSVLTGSASVAAACLNGRVVGKSTAL